MRLKIALPKGRLFESTFELLSKSGIDVECKEKVYKPKSNLKNVDFFIVKPRNIPLMVGSGMVDAGIVGKDLVIDERQNKNVDFLLDLKTMPVYFVVAGKKKPNKNKTVKVATEYQRIAKDYLRRNYKSFRIFKTYGSTECFVPDFADLIIDHVQTGSTIRENKLKVLEVIMKSTTQFISSKKLNNSKSKLLKEIKAKLEKGLKKMDLSYENFPKEEEIRRLDYTK